MSHVSSIKMRRVFICACLLLPIYDSSLFAALPDAGQLLREQQPQRQIPERTTLPEKGSVKEGRISGSGMKIVVKEYRFTGFEALVKESELQKLVADTIGKELDDGDLDGILKRINEFLRKKGWNLAESYLPVQDITSGIVEISLDKNISDGNMTFNRDKSVRVCSRVLSAIGNEGVRSGQSINERKLERSVLLMNDLPGVSANGGLVKGTVPGSTGVVVDVTEGQLLSGAVWEDSFGNYYTGVWRSSALVSLNDPFGCGDQFSFIGTASENFHQGKFAYNRPLGSSGLKANLFFSPMHFKIGKDFSALDVRGKGWVLDADISYPLLRGRLSNVTAMVGYERMFSSGTILGTKFSESRVNSCLIGLKGDIYDQAGGYSTWNGSVTAGTVNDSSLITDPSLIPIEGGFTRANMGFARLQQLSEMVSLNLSWVAQISLVNLDSSQKIYLGGPFGIRAYPIGEASGDAGQLFNIDLRLKLPVPARYGTVQLSGFYDAGRITMHIKPWANSIFTATGENTYWLQ
ncbi:MAG: ShlB/FhaC/HecB family hemolysin secretion/activation protein, partial [Chlorobiaceae bacterium]|nr:ShlB/FhaC/HecB family hemolysin secretion/activation protein [Chlorobiaceae bacterium]